MTKKKLTCQHCSKPAKALWALPPGKRDLTENEIPVCRVHAKEYETTHLNWDTQQHFHGIVSDFHEHWAARLQKLGLNDKQIEAEMLNAWENASLHSEFYDVR